MMGTSLKKLKLRVIEKIITMSQISFLADQYEQMALTSDKINNSVIALKKRSLIKEGHYPKLTVSKEELEEAFKVLIPFLENVNSALTGTIQESSFLPSLVFEDYKHRLSSNQFLKDDIEELIERLKSDRDIDSKSILMLDELLTILDIERSTLFRRLRKARG
jgi:hypothetical protein